MAETHDQRAYGLELAGIPCGALPQQAIRTSQKMQPTVKIRDVQYFRPAHTDKASSVPLQEGQRGFIWVILVLTAFYTVIDASTGGKMEKSTNDSRRRLKFHFGRQQTLRSVRGGPLGNKSRFDQASGHAGLCCARSCAK